MPELPEVETIRRDLIERILNKEISDVVIRLPKIIQNEPEFFRQTLVNNSIIGIERTGKLLQLQLKTGNQIVLIHLKMTGQLLYQHRDLLIAGGHPFPSFHTPLPNKWTHIELGFSDGGRLYFNDLRQFGYWKLVTQNEQQSIKSQYGIEPLTPNFTWENFKNRLGKKKGILKAVLLDQRVISGLGNIYADEVCFFSKLHPASRVEELSELQLQKVYEVCKEIIALAVENRGTSFRDYRDSEGKEGGYAKLLKVYGREGEPCLVCQTPIEKIKLAGRGTHFCPKCQKLIAR